MYALGASQSRAIFKFIGSHDKSRILMTGPNNFTLISFNLLPEIQREYDLPLHLFLVNPKSHLFTNTQQAKLYLHVNAYFFYIR